jgi:hypothetical protein
MSQPSSLSSLDAMLSECEFQNAIVQPSIPPILTQPCVSSSAAQTQDRISQLRSSLASISLAHENPSAVASSHVPSMQLSRNTARAVVVGSGRTGQRHQQQSLLSFSGKSQDELTHNMAMSTLPPARLWTKHQNRFIVAKQAIPFAPSSVTAANHQSQSHSIVLNAPVIGAFVWALFESNWLPARMVDVTHHLALTVLRQRKPNHTLIRFIGSDDVVWIPNDRLKPFVENFPALAKPDTPTLRTAIRIQASVNARKVAREQKEVEKFVLQHVPLRPEVDKPTILKVGQYLLLSLPLVFF